MKMFVKIVFVSLLSAVLCNKSCYWNRKCSFNLFSSKTPYDTVRGDVRDQVDNGCKVISVWSLHRHGNRNPGSDVTSEIKELQDKIKKEISTDNLGTNCYQDIEDLTKWTWNSTLDISTSFLTGIGYEELYDLGKRIRQKYMGDLEMTSEKVYFRATNEQRTVTSAMAFVHGLYDGTQDIPEEIDEPRQQDDVIRPYENCEKYQKEVKSSQLLADQLAAYDSSTEFLAVRSRVQAKLNINYQLTPSDVYNLYELCRFDRSWNEKLQSPWCSFFTDEDLVVLEYRDDVRHYYRNGYGSQVNVNLGAFPLKDLYQNFWNAVNGNGKSLVSYFTHDTMMEMVFCALGLYKDPEALPGSLRNGSRMWKTSEIASLAVNLIAVLSRCEESGVQTYRVQFLINEKPTDLCPDEGCTWQQFLDTFQPFSNANLDFCTYETIHPESNSSSSGHIDKIFTLWMMTTLIVITLLVYFQRY